jgi:hypothetical protein
MINLSGGTVSVSQALKDYSTAWKSFLVVHHIESIEQYIVATTLGWKVADKTELFANLGAVAGISEQTHIGTVNDRFIASVILTTPVEAELHILKILERRVGSSDPLGLDSIDFVCKDVKQVRDILQAAHANIIDEHNDMHAWLSLRFGKDSQFEAKFTEQLVLDVAIRELQIGEKALLDRLSLTLH